MQQAITAKIFGEMYGMNQNDLFVLHKKFGETLKSELDWYNQLQKDFTIPRQNISFDTSENITVDNVVINYNSENDTVISVTEKSSQEENINFKNKKK